MIQNRMILIICIFVISICFEQYFIQKYCALKLNLLLLCSQFYGTNKYNNTL